MNDTPLISIHGLQFDHVTPATNFVRSCLGFFNQGVSGFHAVIADIQSDLGNLAILAKEKSVDDVLQLTERLPLTANEASRIFGLDLEKNIVIHVGFCHRGGKTQGVQQAFQCFFWFCVHGFTNRRNLCYGFFFLFGLR